MCWDKAFVHVDGLEYLALKHLQDDVVGRETHQLYHLRRKKKRNGGQLNTNFKATLLIIHIIPIQV